MKKTFLFSLVFLLGTTSLLKANTQDSVLIKHQCKIIDNGYYFFCALNDDNKTITEYSFSYSLNIKERTYVVGLKGIDTIKIDSLPKDYYDGFLNSEEYKGSNSFLIFHPDFLKWNNAEKLDFLIKQSRESDD